MQLRKLRSVRPVLGEKTAQPPLILRKCSASPDSQRAARTACVLEARSSHQPRPSGTRTPSISVSSAPARRSRSAMPSTPRPWRSAQGNAQIGRAHCRRQPLAEGCEALPARRSRSAMPSTPRPWRLHRGMRRSGVLTVAGSRLRKDARLSPERPPRVCRSRRRFLPYSAIEFHMPDAHPPSLLVAHLDRECGPAPAQSHSVAGG